MASGSANDVFDHYDQTAGAGESGRTLSFVSEAALERRN
jgi:hypothetical protein